MVQNFNGIAQETISEDRLIYVSATKLPYLNILNRLYEPYTNI